MESIGELKVGFIPFSAPGHMIPLMYLARAFARQGADVTFFTTTANALRFQHDVDGDFRAGYKIKIHALQLPCAELGLPPGLESFSEITTMEMAGKLSNAFKMLETQIEQLLGDMKADCIISDTIMSWSTAAAARLGIPRLVFLVAGYITQSIGHSITRYAPQKKVESDFEPFVLPGLPHKIEMTRSQLAKWFDAPNKTMDAIVERTLEAERKSHGVIVNSFYDLEADYMKYYESSIGMKSWAIGPVALWVNEDAGSDGDNASRSEQLEITEWLDSKEPNSVLYVSFGSMTRMSDIQLLEMAHALEISGHQFIWVVPKRNKSGDDNDEGYLPEGFEERMKQGKKGLIIRNWAPQILILNHPAIGGFVTQCGWNSILESICAGQPIITWPLTSEQFYNEKLVTHVLKMAVGVGARGWQNMFNPEAPIEIVNREQIVKAITFLMSGGKEVEGLRERARELACAAKRATSSGGSSHASLVSLINELKSIKLQRLSKSN